MDVRLPDGTVVTNVPEGITQSDLMARVQKMNAPSVDPRPLMQQHMNSLDMQMARAGAKQPESLPQYAGRFLKGAAIPTATTAVGSAVGNLPGAMAGSALGETLNQKLGVYGNSVLPEVNALARPDLTNIAIAGGAPAIIPFYFKLDEKAKQLGRWVGNKVLPERIANDWLQTQMGPKAAKEAAAILRTPEAVPSYPATAAEKLVDHPSGSVIQSHQAAVARIPGGVSSDAAGVRLAQDLKLAELAKNRDIVTAPMRVAALDAANATGQLNVTPLVDAINQRLATPEVTGAPLTGNTLKVVKRHLERMADPNGTIDAKALYQFKKEGVDALVADTLKQTEPSIAKKFRTTELVPLRKTIDEAIEQAGGKGWKDYLREYAQPSQIIEALTERRDKMYKPIQKATLPGQGEVALSHPAQILPNWLSRPITGTKWLAERYGGYVQPKIDRYIADMYFKRPEQLAEVLDPQLPSRLQPVIDAILRRQAPVAAAVAPMVAPILTQEGAK